MSIHPTRKILFANIPGDGHFSPLTGLAMHLKSKGYDVRWYTSKIFSSQLDKLNIKHYPFVAAMEKGDTTYEKMVSEREKINGKFKKLSYDIIHGFARRAPEYFRDIRDIQRSFPFDVFICDCTFTAIPIVREILDVPVITIGVLPLIETSKDIFPMGMGIPPQHTRLGKIKMTIMRFLADKILFRNANRVMAALLKPYGISMDAANIFDMLVRKSSVFLQSGTPGFEYTRSDLGHNVKFIGALLPFRINKDLEWTSDKLKRYHKVVLITQGTVETDVSKLLVPALEALKNSDYLIIVTTGGSQTDELRRRYPGENIIIEDFIPFSAVMPKINVYITNGGYGGVMLSIKNDIPILAAGVHEGKNEITARIGYFKIGINLNTETPKPQAIREGVEKILNDPGYYHRVKALREEFEEHDPNGLCLKYVEDILTSDKKRIAKVSSGVSI